LLKSSFYSDIKCLNGKVQRQHQHVQYYLQYEPMLLTCAQVVKTLKD